MKRGRVFEARKGFSGKSPPWDSRVAIQSVKVQGGEILRPALGCGATGEAPLQPRQFRAIDYASDANRLQRNLTKLTKSQLLPNFPPPTNLHEKPVEPAYPKTSK